MRRIPWATVDTKVLKLTLLTFMEDGWSRMIDAWLFGIGEDLPATLVDALGHFFDGGRHNALLVSVGRILY